MKKIITLIFFCLGLVQSIWAQDVIVTRQSERIDAKILEVSETEIRYKKQNNLDGPTFVLSTDKVASILYSNGEVQSFTAVSHKEEPQRSTTTAFSKLYNGIEVSVNPLMAIYLGQGGGVSFCADAGFGRRFNNSFYWGMNVGGAFASDYNAFSFGTTARAYFPLNSPMDYYVDVYAGTETDFDNWRFCARLMPGIQIPLSPTVDFRFSTGYMGRFGEISLSYLAVGASFAFHGFTRSMAESSLDDGYKASTKTSKPKKPTLESGLQVGAGVVGLCAVMPSVTLGYKVNKHLNLGIGASVMIPETGIIDWGHTKEVELKYNGITEKNELHGWEDCLDLFLYGSYRLTDNVVSPTMNFDAGARMVRYGLDGYSMLFWINYDFYDRPVWAAYVAPSVGLSWRVASNSYLEMKCGYDLSLAFVKDETRGVSVDDTWFTSHFFLTLGFSQTIDMGKVKNFFGL